MKKFFHTSIFSVWFFVLASQTTIAQVILDPYQYPGQEIHIPILDVAFAEYIVVLQNHIDTATIVGCDMYFQSSITSNFTSQSLQRIQVFIDGEVMITEMSLSPGEHWEFFPGGYIDSLYGSKDTVLLTFVSDIPDTIAPTPLVGEYLSTTLSCRYRLQSDTLQTLETNTSGGQTLVVTSVAVGIDEFGMSKLPIGVTDDGYILILNPPVEIKNVLGEQLHIPNDDLYLHVSSGLYFFTKKTPTGDMHGKISIK